MQIGHFHECATSQKRLRIEMEPREPNLTRKESEILKRQQVKLLILRLLCSRVGWREDEASYGGGGLA